jgi:hypothetical protein
VAVFAGGAGTDGRGDLGLRVHRASGRLAAQDRAIRRIAEPDNAVRTNSDAVHTLGSDKCPIRAADIFKYPGVLFVAQHRVMPRHARVGHDDVRTRIPAQLV